METSYFWSLPGFPDRTNIFLIYINDISSDLSLDTLIPQYADNAKLCQAISTHIDCDILNSDLRSVHSWSDTWDMSFNLGYEFKCKHLRITKKKNPVSATYQLGHNELSLSKEEKDLGVVITHNLSWHEHIMSKVSTAN